jgi:pilus assembly protein CpaF
MDSGELKILQDDKTLAVFTPAPERIFLIGSDDSCDLKIDSLHPKHARVDYFGNQWWIQSADAEISDLELDGRKIFREALIDGMKLSMSGTAFQIKVAENIKRKIEMLREDIYQQLLQRLNIHKVQKEQLSDRELEDRANGMLARLINENREAQNILNEKQKLELREEIIQDLLKLGPLEPLIADDDITEIMVVNHLNIYIEKKGKIQLSDRHFRDENHLLTAIERIVAPIGRRIDESSPLVDARLHDGSRVNAVIPPIVPDGACLTIRKFGKDVFTVERLMRLGSMVPEMAQFLECCVKGRKNIVVSGGTGSGKTSLLNAISMFLPNDERIVTIEDSLELKLQQKHVVRMEARPPNTEGKGEVTIRTLVKNSLRMRPDRIVVGECRGGEALDMLQAMNTGHDGSLTTVHANSPKDAISRLETLVLMAGMELPSSAIRDQIFSAVNLIVQTTRLSDGTRKIVSITEITGDDSGNPVLNEIFKFKREGIDHKNNNKVLGHHVGMNKPSFMEEFRVSGIPMDEKWFEIGK